MSIQKIVVTGPESTGKSTLSESLAGALHTCWVKEYAREYLENLGRPYGAPDLLTIAVGQLQLEDRMCENANRMLICDTDLHVIKVWSEYKYNQCDLNILHHIAERKYDLYLLTGIDIPWQDDPLREHPATEMRNYFYNTYKDIVINSGVPWVAINGKPEDRLQDALKAIETLLPLKA